MTTDIPLPSNQSDEIADRMARSWAAYEHARSHWPGEAFALDEFLRLSEEAFARLYPYICASVGGDNPKRRPEDKARFEQTVSMILANMVQSVVRDYPCHYSRANTTYSKSSLYKPDFLTSEVLPRTVDALGEAGYLKRKTTPPGSNRQFRSTIEPTPALTKFFVELRIGQNDLDFSLESRPVLVLKDNGKRRLQYAPSEKQEDIESVRRINRFLCNAKVALAHPDGTREIRPTPLRRIYNNSTFSHGGRYYGGSWQNLKSTQRPWLLIEGQATVERDFSGCIARLLYAEKNMAVEGDPYYVPEIYEAAIKQGKDLQEIRDTVKTMFPILLNSKGQTRFESHDLYLPDGMSNTDAFSHLMIRHLPIYDKFFKQPSAAIMNKESEICRRIMEDAVSSGIVVLPIHDSFICQTHHENWLTERMRTHHIVVAGVEPVIH